MIPFNSFKKNTLDTLPLRERYFQGLVFNVGQFVTDGKQTFEILERGPNYVTVRDKDATLSKKFITSIQLAEEDETMNSGVFKGYKFKNDISENEEMVFACENLIEQYYNGEVSDAIAVIKILSALDEGRTQDAFVSLQRIGQEKNHTYLQEVQKMTRDQIELATKIAEQFGGSYINSPEETIETVLESLVNINHSSAQDAAKGVIELAEEAGIKVKKIGIVKENKTSFKKEHISEAIIEPGSQVIVNTKYGVTKPGKVVFNHGTAIEVKHANGKVSFHPHTNVKQAPDNSTSNAPTPTQKQQLNHVETLGAKDATDPKLGQIGPVAKDNAPETASNKAPIISPQPSLAKRLMAAAKLQDVNQ